MSGLAWLPAAMVVAVVLATIALGAYATRLSRTASDFFVAGRAVNVFWNASAISGEYLSAASFLGVAGLVMKNGYDALWFPIGYAAGYLLLLLFIAGPLRRFGAYTIPDFAEGRFHDPHFRRLAVTFVLFIGFFYTMPQMKGAGITLGQIFGTPYWVGVVVVGAVIALNVALGGMKGITLVQAFQYWLKMFAIAAPVFILFAFYGGYARQFPGTADGSAYPRFREGSTVKFKGHPSPANVLVFPNTVQAVRMTFVEDALIRSLKPSVAVPEADEIPASAFLAPPGELERSQLNPETRLPMVRYRAGTSVLVQRVSVRRREIHQVDDQDRPLYATARIEFQNPATVRFEAGDPVPNSPTNRTWSQPFGPMTGKYGYPLLFTFSLILGLICGTAGLPHILVRFYTNPDGRSARRTALWVMVLIGAFYLFPGVWGAMGRRLIPFLYANGTTDLVVIRLPELMGTLWGPILQGVTCAGAFAAFMSTFSGLLVSMSGALAHDIYGKILRPNASPEMRVAAFRLSAVIVGAVAILLGLRVETFDIARLVGWAFAIAAASYFPLLLLGSWWRGLTAPGAAAGMLAGGITSSLAILCVMLLELKWVKWELPPLAMTLMDQPAIWAVPLSIGAMVLLSFATRHRVPKDANRMLLRLHAPEELGLSKDYITERG